MTIAPSPLALIVGGSSGMGFATARFLLQRGIATVIVGKSQQKARRSSAHTFCLWQGRSAPGRFVCATGRAAGRRFCGKPPAPHSILRECGRVLQAHAIP